MDARTVAMIARAVSEDEATALIQKFADAAVVKATKDAWVRFRAITDQALDAPLVQRAHLHDAERIPDVGGSK